VARQRWIHPDFWTDPDIGRLTREERLFFIGCFSNADDEGRLLGNPAYLRSTIFPYDDISIAEVQAMRDRVVEVCQNLVLYEVDGDECLAFRRWERYQSPRYPKPSKLPPPPSDTETAAEQKPCNQMDESLPQEGDCETTEPMQAFDIGLGREGMGREGRGDQPPPPDATTQERQVLNVLRSVERYPFDMAKDLHFIRKLSVDYPTVDLLAEAKKWATYKLDKPLKAKSNPRSQFRNWCENAKRFAEERRARDGPRRTQLRDMTDEATEFVSHIYGRKEDKREQAASE